MKEEESKMKRRRWLGVLLSLFVPGFGLARAGRPLRAVAWFFGLSSTSLIAAYLFASERIPFLIGVFAVSITLLLQIAMLCDSFRDGRMTKQLWFIYLGIFILLFILPPSTSVVLKAHIIPTNSMSPTLLGADSKLGSDYVIVDRLSYRFSKPQRGDLLVFDSSEISGLEKYLGHGNERSFVMRIVGLPGEEITITENEILSDGMALGEERGIPSAINYVTSSGVARESVTKEKESYNVGSDEYFVLGDNSKHSLDSRFWGGVPQSSVIGKVTTIYYPFSRAGRISSGRKSSNNAEVATP